MNKLNAALLCVSLFAPLRAQVLADEAMSAMHLSEMCNDREDTSALNLACNAFINGLQNGIYIGRTLTAGYCPPKTLGIPQGRLIIEKYLRDHPELLDKRADMIAAVALYTAFPCGTK